MGSPALKDYMPRLDGVRAIAVGLVLLNHFAPPTHIVAQSAPGALGVRIFFVLSGYLITRIILDYKQSNADRSRAAVHFYWRRFLRLSPALFLAIGIASALGIATMRDEWWVHLFYLTNFQVAFTGEFGPFGHFWTLAVEEQFYLVWFFLLLFIPRRFVLPVIVAAIALAPTFRIIAELLGFGPRVRSQLLPANIDYLAFGALIAYAESSRHDLYQWIVRYFRSPWLFGVTTTIALTLQVVRPDSPFIFGLIYPLSVSVAAVSLILMAKDPNNVLTIPLSWAPIRHIGKISYGIYVYHAFVPQVVFPYLQSTFAGPFPAIALIALFTALTIIIAELSWWLVERPLSRFKDALLVEPRSRPRDAPALP